MVGPDLVHHPFPQVSASPDGAEKASKGSTSQMAVIWAMMVCPGTLIPTQIPNFPQAKIGINLWDGGARAKAKPTRVVARARARPAAMARVEARAGESPGPRKTAKVFHTLPAMGPHQLSFSDRIQRLERELWELRTESSVPPVCA